MANSLDMIYNTGAFNNQVSNDQFNKVLNLSNINSAKNSRESSQRKRNNQVFSDETTIANFEQAQETAVKVDLFNIFANRVPVPNVDKPKLSTLNHNN